MLELAGKKVDTDNDGYLMNSSEWNEELAVLLAKQEDIILLDIHWEVIFFVRQFYQEFNTSPAMRMLVKSMTQKYGEDKGSSRYLHRLFPKGPAKQVTKIAGLPKPVKCI